MNAQTSYRSKQLITLCGTALFAASCIFLRTGPANAFPKSQHGDLYCIAQNNYENGLPRYPESNSCCWWDESEGDNEISVETCIKCDSEWKNCEEYTPAISAPRGNITTVPKASGTLEIKPEPKIKPNQPKNGEVLR